MAMRDHIQSVEMDGVVYVGGGRADRKDMDYVVMTYDIESQEWDTLPAYRARTFAMTNFNNRLLLIGGQRKDGSVSDELGEWQPENERWIRPFPPMPVPRWSPIATSYQHWLIVAGGSHQLTFLDTMEILDVKNMQWSSVLAPTKGTNMKSITIGNNWYIMGGWSAEIGLDRHVYSMPLNSLTSDSASDHTNWKKLTSLDYTHFSPIKIGMNLFAAGGKDVENKKAISTIHRYVSETDMWVEAGRLPRSLYDCTCINVSGKVYMMEGSEQFYSSFM